VKAVTGCRLQVDVDVGCRMWRERGWHVFVKAVTGCNRNRFAFTVTVTKTAVTDPQKPQ
jgi:NADH dehydrogenase/NADH:ubiquinone oxidoreductase subunit G